ncbi:MAG: sensor histidine kinase [Bacteroidia bacterium]
MFKKLLIFISILSQASSFVFAKDEANLSEKLNDVNVWYREHIDSAEKVVLNISRQADSNSILYFKCLSLLGNIYRDNGALQQSLIITQKAINGNRRHGYLNQLAQSYIDRASTHNKLAEFELGFKYLDSSLSLSKTINNYEGIMKSRLVLGNLWQFENGNQEKALANYRSGLRAEKLVGDKRIRAGLFNGIANCYDLQNQKDSVMLYYRKALWLYNDIEFKIGQFYIPENMASYFYENNQIDSAEYFYQIALERGKKFELFNRLANLYSNLFYLYTRKGQPEKGVTYLRNVMSFREQVSITAMDNIYLGLTEYHAKKQAYDSAYIYHLWYKYIQDSIKTTEKFNKVKELEAKYDNEKLKTQKLEAEGLAERTKSKNKILMLTAGILASLVLIAGFSVMLLRQRLETKTLLAEKNEVIFQQKLNDVLREKQIEKMTALMEGQEKERTRVARELHDSIGAILATLKHHFQLIEAKLGSNDEKYQKAYALLGKASSEVRRISHNIASNVLSKFGLVAALQDLAEEVSSAQKTLVKVQVSGIENRLENSTEIHLFRIIQELVSNALKHAEAQRIDIQLTMHDNELNLIVEDNGKGFDTKAIINSKGMGMENLQNRVTHLNGTLNIDSSQNVGSTFIIDIPINNSSL